MSEKASNWGRFLKPEKLQNHSRRRKRKGEKERAGRKKGGEEKKAMVPLSVFIIATLEMLKTVGRKRSIWL